MDRTEDAAEALVLAESFLLSRPVEHNLVLTILHQRRARPEPGRYWAILDNGEVVGFALRSPLDFVATVTPMSGSAVAALVEAVTEDAPDLPGLNGEAATVAAFAGRWAERTGVFRRAAGGTPALLPRPVPRAPTCRWDPPPGSGGRRRGARGVVAEL